MEHTRVGRHFLHNDLKWMLRSTEVMSLCRSMIAESFDLTYYSTADTDTS